MEFMDMMKDPNLRWETMHRKYGLIFRTKKYNYHGKETIRPICATMTAEMGSRLVRNELSYFFNSIFTMYSSDSKDDIDRVIEMTDKILAGKLVFTDMDLEDEVNVFFKGEDDAIRLDPNDGFAYLGDYSFATTPTEQPKIPLTDLKTIFEEWREFRASVYGIKK